MIKNVFRGANHWYYFRKRRLKLLPSKNPKSLKNNLKRGVCQRKNLDKSWYLYIIRKVLKKPIHHHQNYFFCDSIEQQHAALAYCLHTKDKRNLETNGE